MDRSLIPMTVNYYCSQYLLNTKYNFLSYQSVAQVFIQVNQSHYLKYIYIKKKLLWALWTAYPASRVSFDLPRSVGKRKETLRASSTFRVERALKIQTYSGVNHA